MSARVRGQVNATGERYEGECATVAAALPVIAAAVCAAPRPNTAICPDDGCLLNNGESCPACQVRNGPWFCACGRRLHCPEADLCWLCLRQARMAARRVCACGTPIRTEADQCYRCRHKPRVKKTSEEHPFHWVRRGGILRPVFEQSEVA